MEKLLIMIRQLTASQQYFQKLYAAGASEKVCLSERVKETQIRITYLDQKESTFIMSINHCNRNKSLSHS